MGQVAKKKPVRKLGADVVDRPTILAALQASNPTAKASDVAMYADAFVDYRTAQLNITANGSIVFHPRTGAPIDNPYIGIRDRAGALLRKLRLNTEALW